MKLWAKGYDLDRDIESFTVGDDYLLDRRLVKYDCAASLAHAGALRAAGLLTAGEYAGISAGLREIAALDARGKFRIRREEEDCHTAIENRLTSRCGPAGRKVHTGRSRNDQVLAALRLYERDALLELKSRLAAFAAACRGLAARRGRVPMPGYTHMRRAMPTTIGTWIGCFAAAAADDSKLADALLRLIDQSPLGSAAGFGVPVLNIDKRRSARLMGFSRAIENPIYAQFTRSKFEPAIMHLCSQVMLTLNKLASDLVLFSMPEFGFIELPEKFCTGSSIMPQKKNPDVLELVRGKYHAVLGEEFKALSLAGNLPSGYNRDAQLAKGPLFACLDTALASLGIMTVVTAGLVVNREKCVLAPELFATEEAYRLVRAGTPFRDAYRIVAEKFRAH
ncbi:MAG: argininosuccinate lyase [Elusimicrobia bacterium]|nr:MAG: argininosuccinate lyase [Elusimicrobiota bacterium]KAF0153896.1 MAG: argininosuccinate lyase [Elusimicrobiota bacterium]